MSSPTIIMRVEKLGKTYGHKLIFKNLHLDLAAGTLTLVTGPNGSGKSTLLKIIAGLTNPGPGSIIEANAKSVAYLGHATYLYPGLTALENLTFWGRLHHIKSMHPLAILDKVNLLSHAYEPVRVFSRGMAQRLNFARVLLLDPELLLLDEPFTGMDLDSKKLLFNELHSIKSRGSAVVMVSHDPATDASLADRVLLLEKHALVELPKPAPAEFGTC